MNGKQVFTMSTKLEAGTTAKPATAHKTVVTVSLDGASDNTILGLAMRQLRVDLAAQWRKAGVIPSTFEYELKNHGTGAAVQLTNEQIAELNKQQAERDPIYRAKLLAELQAMK